MTDSPSFLLSTGNHFAYKTICVVGATSGIGRALSERLVSLPQAPTIIAVGRREDRLLELASSAAAKMRIKPLVADIATGQKADTFVKQLLDLYPELDAIVVNAGVQHVQDWANPESIDLDVLEAELVVNYVSLLHIAKGVLTHFRRNETARPAAFVTVTSGLAVVPSPRTANYAASKAAIRSLSLSLRAAYNGSPIKIREISPPLVESELHDHQGTTPALSKIWVPLDVYVPHVVKTLVESDTPEITYGFVENIYERFEREKWDLIQTMFKPEARAEWGKKED